MIPKPMQFPNANLQTGLFPIASIYNIPANSRKTEKNIWFKQLNCSNNTRFDKKMMCYKMINLTLQPYKWFCLSYITTKADKNWIKMHIQCQNHKFRKRRQISVYNWSTTKQHRRNMAAKQMLQNKEYVK